MENIYSMIMESHARLEYNPQCREAMNGPYVDEYCRATKVDLDNLDCKV